MIMFDLILLQLSFYPFERSDQNFNSGLITVKIYLIRLFRNNKRE